MAMGSWAYLLDSGGGGLYMSSRLYNRTGVASGSRRSRQAKRGAAVLPDSAGLERADPVRRTEAGRINAFGAGDSGAAGREPDDGAASAEVLVQPRAGVQPARQRYLCFTDEAGKEFPATAFVQ